MTEVLPVANAHRIGSPVMLAKEDVADRRNQIEAKYGTADELRRTRDFIGLTLEQRIALEDLEDLEFLEGR
ncbi:hypothetical protein KIH79_12450 [Bifidobacterium sp. 82T10]|uniref:Uncharacterized protein n=1 Tax=Bifidobacterium miconis TaxID=2834435 RepID=A0ABS6WI58_9BIFI|nr:hypothetical protein [Bifidobacterium miconis]MBW3093708.1 hypothetical protein [Bifidobacterium miconis]